ncbi:autophagy-related 4a isoform X5 [Rhipicephalus microplus]|uniref:autophagy-related 4a isoform X5 n=1 Tax=Rhipicephalus microplus TaxID=6941 RepID=UPI003F6B8267
MVGFVRGDMLQKQLARFRSTWELYLRPSLTYEVGAVEYDDFKPSEEPVYILGTKYSTFHELDDLRSNITSKIWLTYRKNFPSISGTDYTSDTGWGCMLRCGQMVVAEAVMRRHLGKDWQWSQRTKDEKYLRILRMFQDKKNCTYSIHQIGKICRVEATNTEDGIRNRMQPHGGLAAARSWKPLVLFIPLRLGLSEINPVYYCGLKRTFALKQSLGIIGGKPNHALYIIGVVGDDLVFLDPHTTQLAVDLDVECPEDESYHCAHASRMDIGQLDPSIALCFYMATEAEFDSWCNLAHKHLISHMKQPLFEITEHRPLGWPDLAEDQQRLDEEPQSTEFTVVEQERKFDTSDDEFEIL